VAVRELVEGEDIVDVVGVTEEVVRVGVAVVMIRVEEVPPEVIGGIMDIPDTVGIVVSGIVVVSIVVVLAGSIVVAIVMGLPVVIGAAVVVVTAPDTPVVANVVGVPGAVLGEGQMTVGG
jgi:hypothetical protein